MTHLATIAATLQTTEKNTPARILRMKIGADCPRCNGSGRYSFNQMDGDRCWGCKGAGNVMPGTPAEWQAVAERATQAAADGTLAAYVARIQAQARCKNGIKRAFAAWNKMEALNQYSPNWRNLDALPNRDQVVARNKVGADLIDTLNKLDKYDGSTDWVEFDRVLAAGLARITEITAELEVEKQED